MEDVPGGAVPSAVNRHAMQSPGGIDTIDGMETDGLQPARRLPLFALTLRLAAASAVIAGLSLYARAPSRAVAPVAEAPVEEVVVPFVPSTPAAPARPAAPQLPGRLALADGDSADPVRIEPARINPATGLREETVTRGDFAAIEAPALRLTLTREAGPDLPPSLFVTLARRAADGPALAVIRTGQRGRIATKFGAVEILEATLAGATRRVCTGFATLEAAPIRIDGWLCAPLGQPPEPRALACTLDGLMLDGASEPAASVFREAEGRRDPACATARPSATAEAAGRTGSIRARRPQGASSKSRG